jgi:FKBP-type peptidyl-prolyl cis-trans isomerase FkpA
MINKPTICLSIVLFFFQTFSSLYAQKVTAVMDSMHATTYLATIVPGNREGVTSWIAGISGQIPYWLELFKDKKETGIGFRYPKTAQVVTTGNGVKVVKNELVFPMEISALEAYQLMITIAGDSAGNFTIYSGYAFLPKEGKWKLIGTLKQEGFVKSMHLCGPYFSYPKKDTSRPIVSNEWIQRTNGSWERLDGKKMPSPQINLLSHVDSLAGVARDEALIQAAFAANKVPAMKNHRGIYYKIEKEGTGKQVSVSDSVKVFYKGYLFPDGAIFDQTDKEARTFPLQRLITGWQYGLPLLKEGGKITLVIPAHLGYSIRTRSPKIPPNSILVFDIEVTGTTPTR